MFIAVESVGTNSKEELKNPKTPASQQQLRQRGGLKEPSGYQPAGLLPVFSTATRGSHVAAISKLKRSHFVKSERIAVCT